MTDIQNNPLVSIIVITYNSSKYVLETLESAKAQTYQNIELIISDDCSTDNTVEICKQWLEDNNECFVMSELITTDCNSGIPANANRGANSAKGLWLKFIAGDDALFPNSIDNIIKFGNKHPDIEILLTQVEVFANRFEKGFSKGILLNEWQNQKILLESANVEMQIEYLLNGNYFPAPGFFFKRKLFLGVNGFNEENRHIEDIPFYFKVLYKNIKVHFTPILTVKYRKHAENMTALKNYILPRYMLEYFSTLVLASKRFGCLKFTMNSYWNFVMAKWIFKLGNNGPFCNFLNKTRISLQPIRFYNLLIKMRLIKKTNY